jgi:hypothetical protein
MVHPLDNNILYKADRAKIAKIDDLFKITYAIDSGTINPVTYTNGTVFDICHGAMTCTPIDHNIERYRTVNSIIYISDDQLNITSDMDWNMYDDGFARSSSLVISHNNLKSRIQETIHDLIMTFTESEHILWMKDKIENNSILFIDGSVYPKRTLYSVAAEDNFLPNMLKYDPTTERILQNYIDIANHGMDNNIPLLGIVKNPIDSQIMRSDTMKDFNIWKDDTQLFKYILNSCKDDEIQKTGMTYTCWFWQPNRMYGTFVNKSSPLAGENMQNVKYPEEFYDPVFFMIYIPRTHTIFKIESLYGFIKQPDTRKQITQKILREVALNGSIPQTLVNADHLAKINQYETSKLKDVVDKSVQMYDYNAHRWPEITNGEI